MKEWQEVIGPEKEIVKRKDKPIERSNAKKLKRVQLDGWGENPVKEPRENIEQWLHKTSQEEQKDHCWPQVSSQNASKRMKQLELSFSKILEAETEAESGDEHVRRMEKLPNKLHDEPDPPSIPYVRKTGKMSKKETIEQTTKNKSILDWASKESNIPGLREAEEDDIGRCGWSGTRDMPEEVRRARTTGGTIQLQKSQEVKDGPEGWKVGKDVSKKDDDLKARGTDGSGHRVQGRHGDRG